MKVKVVKRFRHYLRTFDIGEISEVVEVDHPLTWRGEPIYDFYVKFPGYYPIGVKKEEVEPTTE